MPSPFHRFLPVPAPRRPLFRPRLEPLDDRITPAITFNPMTSFTAGTNPSAVAFGDFNGDGWADLVTANPDDDTVSVLLNGTSVDGTLAGVPAFDVAFPFAVGTQPGAVAVADFNGDGRDDIAVINRQANTVSVLRNITPNLSLLPDGSPSIPSFAAKVDLTFAIAGSFPSDIVAGDFNGDGRMDLAVACVNGGGGVAIFKNTSPFYGTSVSFDAATKVAIPNQNPQGLAAADLNGDGRTDLAVSLRSNDQVAVLGNTTDPNLTPTGTGFDPAITFAAAQTFATATQPGAVRVGDFDGDGKYDLAVVNEGFISAAPNYAVSVLRNATTDKAATFAFAPQVLISTFNNPRGLAVGDFDGDGRTDLTVASTSPSLQQVLALRNTTVAGETTPMFEPSGLGGAPGSTGFALVAADFDRDGRADLALPLSTGKIGLLENATTTTIGFAPQKTFAAGGGPFSVAVGDFDGDGLPDLAVANRGSNNSNTVSVLRNTSTVAGVVSYATQKTFTVGTGPFSVAVGDFDGNGKLDLAVANQYSNTVSILRNTSTGTGVVSFAPQRTFAAGGGPFSVAVGDFDGDSKADLAVANNGSNTVSVLRNTSTGTGNIGFAVKVDFAVGIGPISVAVGDFDGDSKPDLAVANNGSDTVSVLRNTSTGTGNIGYAAKVDFAVGIGPISVAVGDFDGDSKPDLAVANNGSDTVSVLRNTSTGTGNIGYAAKVDFAVGIGPISVAVGDFDGDSKADLAVANNGSNTVSVLRNTSTGTGNIGYAAKVDFAVGSFPRSVAVGDFDGDGKPDLAVANRSSNTVSVLRNVPTVRVTGPAVVVAKSDGVWAFDRITGDWKQLLSTPATQVAAAANGNAIAVFPGYGTYYYRASDNSWTKLHAQPANAVAMDPLGNAYANFSGDVNSAGTYRLSPDKLVLGNENAVYGWVKLAGTEATTTKLVVAANGDVAASFDSFGVYRYRPLTGWQKLNSVDAAALAIGGNGQIVVTFVAQAVGVYQWRDGPSPTWAYLGMGYNATNLAVNGNGNVAATFNSPALTNGVQVARSSAGATTINWTTIHQGTVANSLAVDVFGNAYFQLTGFGVYEYSVYPGYTRRATFAVNGLGVGR